MKNVIINEKNAAKIMQAFAAKQGRASVRTINSFDELVSICKGIEKRVGISKRAMDGTTVHYDFRQHFPNAYKFRPESTHFDLTHKSGKWCIDIDSISRYTTPNKNTAYEYTLSLSETAKTAVLENYV